VIRTVPLSEIHTALQTETHRMPQAASTGFQGDPGGDSDGTAVGGSDAFRRKPDGAKKKILGRKEIVPPSQNQATHSHWQRLGYPGDALGQCSVESCSGTRRRDRFSAVEKHRCRAGARPARRAGICWNAAASTGSGTRRLSWGHQATHSVHCSAAKALGDGSVQRQSCLHHDALGSVLGKALGVELGARLATS
jgi:hypothetical protein